jgi:hypothetical protein
MNRALYAAATAPAVSQRARRLFRSYVRLQFGC